MKLHVIPNDETGLWEIHDACGFRHEFASDSAVQVEQEMLVERRGGKGFLLVEGEFDKGDPLGQQRG